MATSAQTIERKAFQFPVRYLIGILILVPMLAHLFYFVSRSPFANYYVTVDELAAQTSRASKVRVGGEIVGDSTNWDNASRTLNFQIESNGKRLPVRYRGFAPDTFRDGATAIIEGELNHDGTFTAYSVLIKCPHQYVPL